MEEAKRERENDHNLFRHRENEVIFVKFVCVMRSYVCVFVCHKIIFVCV